MIKFQISYKLLTLLLVSLFVYSSCIEDPDDYIPPTQPVVTENPDSTLGNLTAEIIYYNGHYSAAPSGTKVRLYQNAYDLENDIPLYRFETYQSDNAIYFGYLNPGSYYVLAYTEIGLQDYEGVGSIMIIPNQHVQALITMEQIYIE
jgi:hypothetical protein